MYTNAENFFYSTTMVHYFNPGSQTIGSEDELGYYALIPLIQADKLDFPEISDYSYLLISCFQNQNPKFDWFIDANEAKNKFNTICQMYADFEAYQNGVGNFPWMPEII